MANPPAESILGDLMLGGVDGVVTTFAVIAGSAGGRLPAATIIVLGVANLLADGFSMAASSYLGTRSRQQAIERARLDEARQIDAFPEGERREVREIFAHKGLSGDLLDDVVARITADRHVWIDTMMSEELRLNDAVVRPLRAATATLGAFVLCGLMPLLPFLLGGKAYPLGVSAALALASFFALGAGKGLALSQNWFWSAAITALIGGSAATLAYAVGVMLRGMSVVGGV
ncbi:VIT1/CCC1 transporter family protein [Sphingomonas sp. TDK1]|uniref:VIT1/CCC1 transporter family protein n=1 Tax=Sphingomonas sp. TDK1 TaxID=453247 RepID=UPI000A036BFA|nr:VIT1/CCC1 transporter family protein [Sphingomonas sp. TDK1]